MRPQGPGAELARGNSIPQSLSTAAVGDVSRLSVAPTYLQCPSHRPGLVLVVAVGGCILEEGLTRRILLLRLLLADALQGIQRRLWTTAFASMNMLGAERGVNACEVSF